MNLEKTYSWVITLMAIAGFVLGLVSVLLVFRLTNELRQGREEFRLLHKILNKKMKMVMQRMGIELETTPVPDTKT